MLDLVTFLTAWIENLISFSLALPRSFSPVLWGFYCFQRLQSNILDHRSEVCGSIYKWLVWEKEERLCEIGSFCQARLVGNVFPNELVHVGALLYVPLLPSAALVLFKKFSNTCLRISETCFPISWCSFKQVLLHINEQSSYLLVWSFSFACSSRQNTKRRGALYKRTSPKGCSDREDPYCFHPRIAVILLWWGAGIPCHRTSHSVHNFDFYGHNALCAASPFC